MSHYNSVEAPCFAGGMMVRLGDNGGSGSERMRSIAVEDLRPGTHVWTPKGSRKVRALVETVANEAQDSDKANKTNLEVCRIGNLLVTPWHPILIGEKWTFPAALTASSGDSAAQQGVSAVYSVLLEESTDVDAHAIEIGGTIAVTLGHGMVKSMNGDIRAHPFFGDYARISQSINELPMARPGVMSCAGMEKSMLTGLANGFRGL